MQSRIPKRIIQTGKVVQQSLRTRAVLSNLRLLHPDFEYLFFDDDRVEKFIDQEFPQHRAVFDGFRFPIQRFDFFRYLAVYRYGGFYFDLDVLLASGLSGLLDSECVFPFEGLTFSHFLRTRYKMDWEIGNYGFGASAGHPFLEAIIENCVRAQRDPAWVQPMMFGLPPLSKSEFYVLNTTGPGLVSRTLAENPDLARMVTVLFPDDVCDFDKWNRFGDLGIHLMDGSWRMTRGRVRRRLAQDWEAWKLRRLMKESRAWGKTRRHNTKNDLIVNASQTAAADLQTPLVSILIPAYNAQEWVADTIRSAMAQTWPRKEIIVVDDGSTDQTAAIALQFESKGVRVISQRNQGASAARNAGFALSRGDYIQWLDADDLLAPDKIARQMEVLRKNESKTMLLSGSWGRFMYRPWRAKFTPTALWSDLSPGEWLHRKLEQNIYMQTATWLVSRELTEAAGQWDTRLLGDDDGEYFCRVLLASDGVRFVQDSKVYYRSFGYDSLGYVGLSTRKSEAHWLSMRLHIGYLRSLEESARSRAASLRYLRNCLIYFYPERIDILEQAREMATELGEPLGEPSLSWKYRWIKATFGWVLAKRVQISLRKFRWQLAKAADRAISRVEKQTGRAGWRGEILGGGSISSAGPVESPDPPASLGLL
jgi:glycosyltransferase involved in cell wall biosynthesis